MFALPRVNVFLPVKNSLIPLSQFDVDFSKFSVQSHSFRSGMATALAQLGYDEPDLMDIGRWSSQSYKAYTKLGRSIHVKKLHQMSRDLVKLSKSNSSSHKMF